MSRHPSEMDVAPVIPMFRHTAAEVEQAATIARRKALWDTETDEVALWRDLALRFYEAATADDADLLARAVHLFEVARDSRPDPYQDELF